LSFLFARELSSFLHRFIIYQSFLEWCLNLGGWTNTNLDRYYIASGSIPERRELFQKLWVNFEDYADTHFHQEIKLHFHQRSWEMYLANALLSKSYSISSLDKGPDLKTLHDGSVVWIEAVAATRGEGEDKVPVLISDGRVRDVPEDAMLMRFANSLETKRAKYDKYISDGLIKKDEFCIIAVNTGETDNFDPGIPLIFKCLFAIGFFAIPQVGKGFWKPREVIHKKNGSPVRMDFFKQEESRNISAVIYSNKTVLNHPENLGEDCIVVHNPHAFNQLPLEVFKSFEQWKVDGDNIIKV